MVKQTLASRLGMIADDHVLKVRRKFFPHRLLLSDGYLYHPDGRRDSLRRGWGTFHGLEPYLATIRLALQSDKAAQSYVNPSTPGAALKPDLADFETREVWEIKPDSRYGDASGAPQLALYVSLLNVAEREYLALSRDPHYCSANLLAPIDAPRVWKPGAPWGIPDLDACVDRQRVRLNFAFTAPGVIQWRII